MPLCSIILDRGGPLLPSFSLLAGPSALLVLPPPSFPSKPSPSAGLKAFGSMIAFFQLWQQASVMCFFLHIWTLNPNQ